MMYQITEIEFDCSLEDDDWTEQDQIETEEMLPSRYIGTIWDADDEDDLVEEITAATGWCIKSLNFRHILK